MSESAAITRRFDDPDERREFPLGHFALVRLGGMSLGRAEYAPGWRWSEHVGAAQGQSSCQVPHLGLVLSGRNRIEMDDGRVLEIGPGDLFEIGPGHDSVVIGNEPYVSLHFLGADQYAAR
ncbi:MAG: cupin domain-containing protein [Candidatus Limnocylindria bacterium]